MTIDELTHAVIGAAMTVHTRLGPGFLEEVYQNALLLELAKQNLPAPKEVPLDVRYDGVCVGHYQADIIVDRRLILELKAVSDLHPATKPNSSTTSPPPASTTASSSTSAPPPFNSNANTGSTRKPNEFFRQDLQD